MVWMRPVSWGRWGLAMLLVTVALVGDVRGPAVERYPFAAAAYPAGTPVASIDLEWRDVTIGLLPAPELDGFLRVGVEAGTPLGPHLVRRASLVPDDWWVIQLPLQGDAAPGMQVRVVVLDAMTSIEGVVVGAPSGDAFGGDPHGAVAVPAASADLVARASADDRIVTLLAAYER